MPHSVGLDALLKAQRVCWLPVLGLALAVGCASSERHRKGRELAEAGEYDEAVVEMRGAAEENPSNPRYQLDLADTQMSAADKHLATAEKLLAQNQAGAAREHVVKAQELAPGHPRAIRLAGEIEGRVQQARDLTARSREALKAAEWVDAVVLAREAVRSDASNAEGRKALADAESAAKANNITIAEAPAEPPPRAQAEASPREAPRPPGEPTRPPRTRREGRRRPAPPVQPPPPPAVAEPLPAEGPPAAFRGILSRDDDRYPKRMETLDGIVVKLEDTDSDPPDADVTIRVGRYEMKRKHLRVGQRIYGRGLSGASYRLLIEGIDPKNETIYFLLEPAAPPRRY